MAIASANFVFLETYDPQLVRFAGLAERYFADDPNGCLVKLRMFGELLATIVAARYGLMETPDENQADRLRRFKDRGALPQQVLDLFHHLRIAGNDAVHDFGDEHRTALTALKKARALAVWFHQSMSGDRQFKAGPFLPPRQPVDETPALRAELERLQAELEASRTTAQQAEAKAQEEADQRLSAVERAERAERERTEWEVLAQEIENDRTRVENELAALQAQAEAAPQKAIEAMVEQGIEAGQELALDERETRRLIDAQLRAAGWEADTETINYKTGTRPQKAKFLAIAEWPTENGPADYVLFHGLTAIAVVEAKRIAKDVSALVQQAKRYSRGYAIKGTDALPEGSPWEEFHVPFVFATNGRPYLKQIETKSGIWFCDLRRPTNLSRALEGWYSPEGLKEALKQDIDTAHDRLRQEEFTYGLQLRDYQRRAILAIEEALANDTRQMLVAMATGTGKTSVAIALVYRLIKTRRFRRILFLVDRTALGEQSAGAFKTARMEQQKPFTEIYDLKELGDIQPDPDTKVQIATVQSLVKRILFAETEADVPTVDQYDCIIVDECHRGYLLDQELSDAEMTFRNEDDYISKYRRVLEHFDAVKIGLTATPALHTVQIFGEPLAQASYTYREAVIDGWLIDHEPPHRIVTELAEEGIEWKAGDPMEIYDTGTGRIDLVHVPDDVKMEIETFNRKVVTRPFNRVVCEELAKHIDPTLDEKTLIFCATDNHADIVVDELKRAFAAHYGNVDDDAVIKITGAADKPQQLIRRFRNERLPNVAVTVDLLTTGIDVPKIGNLVFIRRVSSRILFEQMLGRATRLCPEIGKTVFHIFDAVDLYAALENLTTMRPVVVDPKISFAQLIDEATRHDDPDARETVVEQIIAKLQRAKRDLTRTARERFEDAAGMTPDALASFLKAKSVDEVVEWFRNHAAVAALLDQRAETDPIKLAISHHEDRLRRVERGFGESTGPEDYLES
ncbi:MAG: type I restriction-modification system endonuclease, partial [Rhodospirillales bacterium]|nr:type I restriction-modification system endonuclease [Rhodospirillales bacterium]